MSSQWDDIQIADFDSETMQLLVEIIGMEAMKKLLATFGGETLYFMKPESVIRSRRDRKIYEAFTGDNYLELAREHDLTTRHVRKIIQEQRSQNPKDGLKQQELF
ncbi:MAG: hypothetical protein JEZ12_23975 [Desulfobacterium sp.]|nr:hypothetical protein [Desulfobacterium sp.]